MSNWSLPPNSGVFTGIGADTSDSGGVSVTAGTRTPGSWVELSASLAKDYGSIKLHFSGGSGELNQDRGYFELALGAAGSEKVCWTGHIRADRGGVVRSILPVRLPAGERLAIRATHQSSSISYNVIVEGGDPPLYTPFFAAGSDLAGIEKAGSSTTHGRGVGVDPGATADTKSSWVELVASTAERYRQFVIIVTGDQMTSLTNALFLFDVALGAAGSEEVIVENYPVVSASSSDVWCPEPERMFDRAIPSGTRIAVRAQADFTSSPDRLLEFGLIGLK